MTNEQYQILIRVDERVGTLLAFQLKTEERLRRLEKARNWLAGVITAVAALFGYHTDIYK